MKNSSSSLMDDNRPSSRWLIGNVISRFSIWDRLKSIMACYFVDHNVIVMCLHSHYNHIMVTNIVNGNFSFALQFDAPFPVLDLNELGVIFVALLFFF